MNEDELLYICRQFANMFGINVSAYEKRTKIFFQSIINVDIDPVKLCFEEIIQDKSEINYYIYDNSLYFGSVKHEDYKIILGPVSELRYSAQDARKISLLMDILPDVIDGFSSEIQSMCGIHLDTLLQILILLNYTINRTIYGISDLRIKKEEQKNIVSEIKEKEVAPLINSDFFDSNARTVAIEKDIVKKVMNGDTQGLIDGASKVPAVSSGNLASDTIRHQKNFFIRLETIVSRAAIQAGADINEIFYIEEMYIAKCESLNSIDRIKNLQYHMILDYAERVKKIKSHNKENSKIVNDVSKYIQAHIYETIKTSDIAEFLGKNRTSFTVEFKKKAGINLSDFIKIKKIDEAKELIIHTDKTLSQIAYILGFSSQSHFCRVFKDFVGETPMEYRKKIPLTNMK